MNFSPNNKNIILVILGILLVWFIIEWFCNKREGMEDSVDEAVLNIASIYNQEDMKVTNMEVIGELNVTGKSFNLLPKGMIIAWHPGTILDSKGKEITDVNAYIAAVKSKLPFGWTICDGKEYQALDGSKIETPDLSGKFILGAGSKYKPGATGGAETVTLNTNQIPKHRHSFGDTYNNKKNYGEGKGYAGGDGDNYWKLSSTSPTDYTSYVGGNQAHENMPPYYTFVYLMKL